jgi:hypothetical protein
VRGWIARSGGAAKADAGDATVYTIQLEGFEEQRMVA